MPKKSSSAWLAKVAAGATTASAASFGVGVSAGHPVLGVIVAFGQLSVAATALVIDGRTEK